MGSRVFEEYFTLCLLISILLCNLCNSLTVSNSSKRARLPIKHPRSSGLLRDTLIGRYVNRNHDIGKGRTDDHYVEISYLSATTLKWTTRSGKSWTLSFRPEGKGYETRLLNAVEDGSSSSNPSYWSVSWNSGGTEVVSVMGPSREYFTRVRTSKEVIALVEGTYECIEYQENDKNDWHFVKITKESDTRLKWTNNAGQSWFLDLIEYESGYDVEKLKVDEGCPYYEKHNYREAVLYVEMATNSLRYILGPFNERYLKIYTTDDVRNGLIGSYYSYSRILRNEYRSVTITKHPCSERGSYWNYEGSLRRLGFLNKAFLGFDSRTVSMLTPWDGQDSEVFYGALLVWNPYLKRVIGLRMPYIDYMRIDP